MTLQQAEDWMKKVGGKLTTTQTIEGAKNVEQALMMSQISVVTFTVGKNSLKVLFGSPMVKQDLLFAFMVEYFISSFGDLGHPVV